MVLFKITLIQLSPPGLNSEQGKVFLNPFSTSRRRPLLATTGSYHSRCIQRLKFRLALAEKGSNYKERQGIILATDTGSVVN